MISKSHLLKRRANVVGVMGRVGQRGGVDVSRIADHQRHPLLRAGRDAEHERADERESEGQPLYGMVWQWRAPQA